MVGGIHFATTPPRRFRPAGNISELAEAPPGNDMPSAGAVRLEHAYQTFRSRGYNRFLTYFALTSSPVVSYTHATRLHLGRLIEDGYVAAEPPPNCLGSSRLLPLGQRLSGMWHNHAGDGYCASAAPEAEQHAGSHGAGHSHGHNHCHHAHGKASGHVHALATDQDQGERCPSSDDDCVVCRFVAQSAVRPVPAPEPYRGEQVAELRQILPAAPPPVFLACGLARAPPVCG